MRELLAQCEASENDLLQQQQQQQQQLLPSMPSLVPSMTVAGPPAISLVTRQTKVSNFFAFRIFFVRDKSQHGLSMTMTIIKFQLFRWTEIKTKTNN